ncbi:MAG TPA: Coenzyme F420 hydrogenase/dehydrogenase, beta subunit C-terminal domain [Candidatus Paceibacterota bacterium]|nr:Coenzyme F420 hydrogenase/dehydrogenase, beta subunit C-terminal domain [Candidatus Paceibacterota bacterium]
MGLVYSAWSLDDEVRINSTSGGIFTELAKQAISEGYYVAGAKYNSDFTVEHDLISTVKDIEILRQSKYVESDMSKIREKMQNKKVMFVGSPCQCASVKADLKIDFICRGMPVKKAYLKYLEMLEKEYKSKIKKVWFKNKTLGWNNFATKILFENGESYLKKYNQDLYMKAYLVDNIMMKTSCYNCKFKGPRISDITLGDFWGMKDPKGISFVMLNTSKGEEIFNKLNIHKELASLDKAIIKNPCLYKSPKEGLRRQEFLDLLDTKSFDEALKIVT